MSLYRKKCQVLWWWRYTYPFRLDRLVVRANAISVPNWLSFLQRHKVHRCVGSARRTRRKAIVSVLLPTKLLGHITTCDVVASSLILQPCSYVCQLFLLGFHPRYISVYAVVRKHIQPGMLACPKFVRKEVLLRALNLFVVKRAKV